jgi:hypothetical protein
MWRWVATAHMQLLFPLPPPPPPPSPALLPLPSTLPLLATCPTCSATAPATLPQLPHLQLHLPQNCCVGCMLLLGAGA